MLFRSVSALGRQLLCDLNRVCTLMNRSQRESASELRPASVRMDTVSVLGIAGDSGVSGSGDKKDGKKKGKDSKNTQLYKRSGSGKRFSSEGGGKKRHKH